MLYLGENVSYKEGKKINTTQAAITVLVPGFHTYTLIFPIPCKIDATSLLPAEEAVVQHGQAIASRPHSKGGRSRELNSLLMSKPSLVIAANPYRLRIDHFVYKGHIPVTRPPPSPLPPSHRPDGRAPLRVAFTGPRVGVDAAPPLKITLPASPDGLEGLGPQVSSPPRA